VEDKEGAGAKKTHRKQEPDEEEEKLVRSQIYEMQEASPEEKAMIPAVIVGFAKFMDGKVSASSVVTYSHQVRRELMMRLRSLKAVASDEYRALVQRTKYDVRSNRTTSCGISWFSRFYRDVCEQHSGEFKVDPVWDEEVEAARKTRTEFFVDEAGRDVRTGGKGNFSSKYVGVSFNKHVKKWVAVSRQGNKFLGHYVTEEVAAEARAAEANGRALPTPERSIFNMLGATAAAKPVVQICGLFSKPAKDSEVEETVEVVPITDPISLMRIETPVRGKNCCHKAVFDRDSYLEFNAMQEKRKFKNLKDLWLCPICSKPTPESSLVVVEGLAEVLKSAKKKPDLEHVLAMPDGTFSLVE
jgi:rubredoxin